MNRTQKVFLGVVGGIFVITAISSAASEDTTVSTPTPKATQTPAPVAVETPAPEKSVKPEPVKPESTETAGQENAVRSAESYLDYGPFSKSGLVDQLKFEGFTSAQATYGAKNTGADWNAEAVESAKGYLDYSAFSKSGLVEQLEFEGFTSAQAAYGANKAF